MDIHVLELLLLLMLGSWEPNDSEPLPPEVVFRHMPTQCEVIGFTDLRGAGDGFRALLGGWREPAYLVEVPDVARGLAYLSSLYERTEVWSTSALGLNPFQQVTSLSFCASLGTSARGLPELRFVVILQGDFDATAAAPTWATELGLHAASEGPVYVDVMGRIMLTSPGPGELVLGSREYVATLATEGVTEFVPEAGSVGQRLFERVPHGVRRFVAFDPGLAMSFLLAGFAPRSVGELVAGLEWALLAGSDEAVWLEVAARSEAALRYYELILEGLGGWAELLPRALDSTVNLMFGLAHPGDLSYSEQALILAEHREAVLALLDASGALDRPEVAVVVDAGTRRASLEISRAAGLQLLARQLLALSYLASVGQLPETVRSFRNVPWFWRERLLPGLP